MSFLFILWWEYCGQKNSGGLEKEEGGGGAFDIVKLIYGSYTLPSGYYIKWNVKNVQRYEGGEGGRGGDACLQIFERLIWFRN